MNKKIPGNIVLTPNEADLLSRLKNSFENLHIQRGRNQYRIVKLDGRRKFFIGKLATGYQYKPVVAARNKCQSMLKSIFVL